MGDFNGLTNKELLIVRDALISHIAIYVQQDIDQVKVIIKKLLVEYDGREM